MTTNIDEKIDASPKTAAVVKQAASELEATVGDFVLPVTAQWQVTTDTAGRPLVQLTLTVTEDDGSETSVVGRYAPSELKDSRRRERELNRVWSNLLAVRAPKAMRRLRDLVASLKDDGE